MYLHHISRRPKDELIRRFFEAQKLKESEGDWTETVFENLKEIGLKISFDEIAMMTKKKYKKLIKKQIAQKTFNDLKTLKQTHTKMENTEYEKFEVQEYLRANSGLANNEKHLLVSLRTRMTKVRKNYKNMYEDHLCQLCKAEEDDQSHLFRCEYLLNNCKELAENISVEYEDIFSTTKKQVEAAKLLIKIWDIREQHLTSN